MPYLLAILTIVACLGYGLSLGKLAGIRGNVGDAGILGLLCLAILGAIIHFFFALGPAAQVVALGAGVALAGMFGRDLMLRCKENPISILVGFSAFFHTQVLTVYDTGLYHLQTFLWNSQFPITVGLGNLHGRLAFNSALFLIAPLDDREGIGWISNLVVLAFVLMSCYARLPLVARHSVEFWFLTLAVIVLAVFSRELWWAGVLNADGFVAILIVYWFSILLSLPADTQSNTKLLLLTAVFAFTIKLSVGPLVILALLTVWLNRRDAAGRPLAAMAIAGVWLGLWTLRGVLLSGCAAYPLPQSCISALPWTVIPFQAQNEFVGIKSWARTAHRTDYENVMNNWNWLGPWAVRSVQDWSARLLLAGLIAAGICVLCGVRVSRLVKAAAVGLAICLTYWFFSAPDVRFGSGYLAAAGILGLSVACATYFTHFHSADFVYRLTLEAIAVSMLVGMAGLKKFGNTWSVKDPPAFVLRTAPGIRPVWVPQVVDQCWDHQVPCTPYFHPDRLQRVRWR